MLPAFRVQEAGALAVGVRHFRLQRGWRALRQARGAPLAAPSNAPRWALPGPPAGAAGADARGRRCHLCRCTRVRAVLPACPLRTHSHRKQTHSMVRWENESDSDGSDAEDADQLGRQERARAHRLAEARASRAPSAYQLYSKDHYSQAKTKLLVRGEVVRRRGPGARCAPSLRRMWDQVVPDEGEARQCKSYYNQLARACARARMRRSCGACARSTRSKTGRRRRRPPCRTRPPGRTKAAAHPTPAPR